ncbi:hypothetical protein BWQ96_02765 [Gracilariopsis chorda]|uniref:Uncharacterized protein n=1 Tax=Gracilariopsis chorda TaxID=448386 RepID=A0A2V3IZ62_9FLOR|nr:hypothetical protein BWQ96_02765 [Gracilariopsis chorda]|eukprot:PXF47434.1 hypothetical protein BWQ96_02765 [Gracilariopsis chorda]
MQSTDTTDAQHAAALAAANLMEVDEDTRPVMSEPMSIDGTATRSKIKREAQQQVPISKPSALRSNPVAMQPRPSEVTMKRTQAFPAGDDISSAKPLAPQHPCEAALKPSNTKVPSATKRFRKEESSPVEKEDRDQVRKRSLETGETPAPKRQRINGCALLAKGFELHRIGSEQWPSELMIIASRDDKNGNPLWGACALCSRGSSPNNIYTQKHPFKLNKVRTHLRKQHPEEEWKNYSAMDPHQKLEFLRDRPSSFEKIRKFVMRASKGAGSWNDAEYTRIYLSNEPIEDLVSNTMKSATVSKERPPRFQDDLSTQRMVSANQSKVKETHKKLTRATRQEQPHINFSPTASMCSNGWQSFISTLPSILHSDDPENNAGHFNSRQEVNWEQDAVKVAPRSPRGFFEASKEYLALTSHFPKHTVWTHLEIPRLVVGGPLRDPWSPKSQTLDDAFLMPSTYLDLPERRVGLITRKGNEHCTRLLSAITLFYLVRGFSCSMIARVLDLMTDESEAIDGKPTGSLLPLIVCVGNSICAESLRVLRNELNRNEDYNWAFPLVTRPCPELSNSGIEIIIPLRTRLRERYDLHLVSVRCQKDAGKTVLKILDAVCQEWKIRLSGINSGVPRDDIRRKDVERAIFEAIVKSDGVQHMVLVSMECPESKRLSSPEAFSTMSEEEFAGLVKSHATRLGTIIRPDNLIDDHKSLPEMIAARSCDEEFVPEEHPKRSRDGRNSDPCNSEFDRKWRGLPSTLKVFAEGLRPLYESHEEPLSQPGCLRAGIFDTEFLSEQGIDPLLERIFHARSLLKVWASQELPVNCRYGPPNRKHTANTAGIWEGNWSNLSRGMFDLAP